MECKKIAIICPARYPVPATKGGAIETLIEILVKENELSKKYNIVIYSYFDHNAKIKSNKYEYTKVVFIKVNKTIEKLNNLFVRIIRKIFKKDLNTSFINKVIKNINDNNIKNIVIEGNKKYVLPIASGVEHSSIFLHIHSEMFLNDYNSKNSEIVKKCNKIIAVSDYIKNKTLEQVVLDKEKIVTLKNCTDINLFNKALYMNNREKLRKNYNIKNNEIIIMFTGRILQIKGVRELILAFKKYCSKLDAKLLIVGNAGFGVSSKSEYDDELINISKELQEKIIFTGFIHNSELPSIHSMVDIAVVPSLWDDPAPLVVIEAMASGIPLIVTDSGGIPEYINDKCSIVIKRDKNIIENIGQALVELIEDEKLRRYMGKNGRNQAEKFDTKNYYNNFVNILRDDGNETYEN